MLYGGIRIPGHPDPENIRALDLLPLPQIRRMMRVGVAIDRESLWNLSTSLESRKVELKKEIVSYVPEHALEEFVSGSGDDSILNVESAEQVATLLFEYLHVGAGRKLRKTKSGKRLSTGKKQLEAVKWDHPIVPKLLEYRECSKLKSTYTDTLPSIARLHRAGTCGICGLFHREPSWRVHTQILTTRTDTGRLASRRPNLQNIPTRSKSGQEVRRSFVSPKGLRLVSRDYSQIELRRLAHAANEPNMIRIFSEGGDIHLDTAMRAFGISDPDQVDKILHRAPCKNVNFGICLLGGQRVLTHRGLVAIEKVQLSDRLWDGVEWVSHEGVVFNGHREVIAYQGIRATADHKVWLEDGRKVPLSQAVAERSRIAVTGCEGAPVRYAPGRVTRAASPQRASAGVGVLYRVSHKEGHRRSESSKRQDVRVPMSATPVCRSTRGGASGTVLCDSSAVLQSKVEGVAELRRARGHERIQILCRLRRVHADHVSRRRVQGRGDRSDGQLKGVRAGQSAASATLGQSAEHSAQCAGGLQRRVDRRGRPVVAAAAGIPRLSISPEHHTATGGSGGDLGRDSDPCAQTTCGPVYDIRNAGPRHRFTCEGRLVSNCYGLGPDGLFDLMCITYATAQMTMPDWLTIDWCDGFIDKWFELYPECRRYLELQHYRARRYGIVWTVLGRVRRVPEVRSVHERVMAAGLRQAGNMPIQGDAADMMKIGMARVERRLEEIRAQGIHAEALLPIHDELLIEVDEEWAEEVNVIVGAEMARALEDTGTGEVECRVPIVTEGSVMECWQKAG